MNKEELQKFVNKILARRNFPPISKFAQEFSNGINFQRVFNILFDEQIDCKLVESPNFDTRLANWSRINSIICFNYLQQKFYLVEPTMNSLAKGTSSESIFKLLKVMINVQQDIFREAIKDTSNIHDITSEIETDRSLMTQTTHERDAFGQVPDYMDDQIRTDVPKTRHRRTYTANTYTGDRSQMFSFLLSQKIDLPDRDEQSLEFKQKKEEYNNQIEELKQGDDEIQTSQHIIRGQIQTELLNSMSSSPKKGKNSFGGLDYGSPLSDMKLSKKDQTVLKNMTQEQREQMQDQFMRDKNYFQQLKSKIEAEVVSNKIDLDFRKVKFSTEFKSLRALANPPSLVMQTLQVMLYQLGYDVEKEFSDWSSIKTILLQGNLEQEIIFFNFDQVFPDRFKYSNKFTSSVSSDQVLKVSANLKWVYRWLAAIVKYQSICYDDRIEQNKIQKRIDKSQPFVSKLVVMN